MSEIRIPRMSPNLVTSPRATLREALETITKNGRQAVLVVEVDGRLTGMVTDGDVRRALLRGVPLEGAVADIMNPAPVTASPGLGRGAAVELMLSRNIRHLPLVDAHRRLVDVLFLEEQIAPPPLPAPAVIMAGGEGRRLQPLTESTPKPLVTVGGKPLVEIMIERLRLSGIGDITIALHHKSEMIRERLGDGGRLGVRIGYALEPRPLGTMGGLSLVRDRLSQPFFVVNADILTKCDFRAMWEFHRRQKDAAMTVGVSTHQVDIPYGEFTLHGERVTRVEEKPRKEFPVNAGIYLLDPSAIELIPPGEYFDATDMIRALLDRQRVVAAYLIREYWLDVGRLADLDKANRDLAEGLLN
jgi:dTDP-glucose pyrophosphorylase